MKKILVLCDFGETRSVAMATVLRERGHFAVAGSYDNFISTNYFNDFKSACEGWEREGMLTLIPTEKEFTPFDEILFMQTNGEHFISDDTFTGCDDIRLLTLCREKAREWGL